MLKIGDFSRLSRVSIRMLRYYDEVGLLKPDKVDDFTGYRYYSEEQLLKMGKINALKDMGCGVNAIAEILKSSNPKEIEQIFQVQKAQLLEDVNAINNRIRFLDTALERLRKDKIMKYKIVADSCCDLTADMKTWQDFEIVPLTLEIGEYRIFDNENFDQDDFISRMKANGGNAKSACPAPDAFKKAYEGDYDAVFVLTITNQLSGTYNSALQGKMLYEEEFGDDKKIIVFDSLATSGIETIVAKKIKELADGGKNAEDIQKEIDAYIVNNTGLYFCLESLDALKSNGRLFALAAKVLEKIRVKLICKRTDQGNISLVAQDITLNRAMMKMSNLIAGELDGMDLSGETLVVSYVCCEDRAKQVAAKICEKAKFGNVEILKASGLNSLYASDGGIIVSYSF